MKLVMCMTVLSIVLLTGCVPVVKSDRIITSSGKIGHAIDCKHAYDMGQCYKRAGETCIKGYIILQETNIPGGFFDIPRQNLVIECKE